MTRSIAAAVVALVLVCGSASAQTDAKPKKEKSPGAKMAVRAPQTQQDPNDPANQDQNVVKVLRTSNKAQINRYVPKVYEFKNVNPGAFAYRLCHDFVAVENGIISCFAAPDKQSGMVLVVVPEYQLAKADELMGALDRPKLTSSSGTEYQYVPLKNRAASDTKFVSGLLMNAGPAGSTDTAALADVETNALFLSGSPSGVQAVTEALKTYDVPTPQVCVAAKVYEVNVNNDGQLGLDFQSWKNGPGKALLSGVAFGEYERVHGSPTQFDAGANTGGLPQRTMSTSGYGGALLYDVPSAFFDFLAVKGKARVVTNTSVSVLSGEDAIFKSLDHVPYNVVTTPAAAKTEKVLPQEPGQAEIAPNTVNDRRVETAVKEVGLELEVTPTIGSQKVNLVIRSKISDLAGFDGAGVPAVATREAESKISVRDGEEVVLGGMSREQTVKGANKVPILGSIPVIGYLFGSEGTSKKSTTVVQVVSATIVRDGSATADQQAVIREVENQ
jgi:general secretion pathway protein D